MASSLPKSRPLALAFILLLVLPLALEAKLHAKPVLTYHRGPIITGRLNLSLLWYGQFGRSQKNTIRTFIKSLNYDGRANFQPQVSTWWEMVGSYQSMAMKHSRKTPRILVNVVKQITDNSYSLGKVMTKDLIKTLVQKATAGNRNTVAVIFTSRQVTASDLCSGQCFEHGVIGKQPYILVGNPESECPGTCAWPFHRSDYGLQGVTLQPPNGNIGADAMVIHFASGLASTVTNPFKTGFYQPGRRNDVLIEATTACPSIFGSGALPGYTGKVGVDPTTGGGFNAHGYKGRKFMLPAIWNPKTSSCWTLL
ncbi:hypothetical protein ACB094_12G093400 [Castanea mollissima]